MERERLLSDIQRLRNEGKTIRGIAAELEVSRGRVERGLKALADEVSRSRRNDLSLGAFVGRQREMNELRAAL